MHFNSGKHRQISRKPYPSDITNEEQALEASHLVLIKEDAPQCEYDIR
jgi:hypothetical protein